MHGSRIPRVDSQGRQTILSGPGMADPMPRFGLSTTAIGALCGVAAATCWAAGFVAAKHGLAKGMSPTDLAFHRFIWSGLLLMPLVAKEGLGNLGGVGWPLGLVMLVLAGPLQAIVSYIGFTLAPLGHGAVIHPASAALAGTLLAFVVLHEPLTRTRILGIAGIVLGLVVFAGEAITKLGGDAPLGDALFMGAGLMWAVFTICLRKWRVSGIVAARIIGTLSLLIYAPLYAYFIGFDRMKAVGLSENLLQIAVQGVFAGFLAIYLFGRSVTALGASRASTFPALVPAIAILIGFIALGDVPSIAQLVGLAIVGVGFRFALKP
jgi:drug/metabolite transporter (DMT)-like permease